MNLEKENRMDFADQIHELAARVTKLKEHFETEEATKTALVLPFLQILGYDIFNPSEVVPEFTADHGVKKGEKVDYAVFLEGSPILLIECKQYGSNLDKASSQLFRYFSVTETRIAVLTDGSRYHFFTDLDAANKMDARPFMILDLENLDQGLLPEIKKLSKTKFDLDQTLSTASELKYTRAIKKIMTAEIDSPTEDFVRFFVCQVYPGRLTAAVKEQFTPIVRRALNDFIDERINERLKQAMITSEPSQAEAPDQGEMVSDAPEKKGLVTTEEEIEGYLIVKSILREVCDPSRVVHRDTHSYMGILLDDNNRKPICRLHFNGKQRYLGLIDKDKSEERVPIEGLNDVFKYAERLKETLSVYDI